MIIFDRCCSIEYLMRRPRRTRHRYCALVAFFEDPATVAAAFYRPRVPGLLARSVLLSRCHDLWGGFNVTIYSTVTSIRRAHL